MTWFCVATFFLFCPRPVWGAAMTATPSVPSVRSCPSAKSLYDCSLRSLKGCLFSDSLVHVIACFYTLHQWGCDVCCSLAHTAALVWPLGGALSEDRYACISVRAYSVLTACVSAAHNAGRGALCMSMSSMRLWNFNSLAYSRWIVAPCPACMGGLLQ